MNLARYLRGLTQRLHKRNESSLERGARFFVWWPIIAIAGIGLILMIGPLFYQLPLQLNERINIFLTLVIAIFAIVEGYSTLMQVILEERKNKIEDVRNELEKAYGTLYSILSKPEELLAVDDRSKELRIRLSPEEKYSLDDIMITYPFIFPANIVALWRAKIRNISAYTIRTDTFQPIDFAIPLEFRDRIEEERISINLSPTSQSI